MRKRFTTLLCAAAILGSVSACMVFAEDNTTTINDTQTVQEGNRTISGDVVVGAQGKIIIENSGNLQVDGGKLTNENIIENSGILKVDRTTENNKTITNNGSAQLSELNNNQNATIDGNNGKMSLSGGSNSGNITQNTITINNSSVGLVNNVGATIKAIDTITNNGKITNNGTITAESIQNGADKTISGNGKLEFIQGHNNGTISQEIINQLEGSLFENTGEITANEFNVGEDAQFNNTSDAKLTIGTGTNDGKIRGGIIEIKGDYTNNGILTINDNSDFIIKEGQTISGTGTFGIKGTNNGTINQKNLETYDDFVNNGTITLTPDGDDDPSYADVENDGNGTFRNSDNITGTGSITVDNGFNDGEIKQSSFTINGTKALDGQGIHFINQGDIIVDNFVNKGNIDNDGYSYGSITTKSGSNSGIINQIKFTVESSNDQSDQFTNSGTISAEIENKGNFTNSGSIIGAITNSGTFTNNNAIGQQGATNNNSITNSGSFTNATGGDIYVTDISNSGKFENNADISASGKITNNANSIFTNGEDGDIRVDSVSNAGTFNNYGDMDVDSNFTNSGSLINNGNLSVKDLDGTGTPATFENTGTIENNATLTAENFTNNNSVTNSAIFNVYNNFTNKSNFTNQNNGQLGVYGDLLNESTAQLINKNNASIDMEGSDKTLTNNGIIKNSQNASINMNYNTLINNGTIENDNGNINDAILENNNKITADNQSWLNLESLKNDNGTIDLNGGSTLDIANQTSPIAGVINSLGHAEETLPDGSIGVIANKISTNDDAEFVGNLNIGDGTKDSYLAISGLNVKEDATVNVAQRASLSVGENATLNLNTGDTVKGDIVLEQGVAGQEGTINLDNFTLETGLNSTLKGGNQAYYSQNGGTLNLLNNSTLKLGDSNAMRGGDLNIDGTSQFLVTSEENGTIDSANFLDNLTIADGGRFGVMNGEGAEYNIENINVNNGTTNFTIDVLGRSNAQYEHGTDQFIGTDINGNGTINIEDWTLAGDIFGWQAPIDRDIKLDNVFDYQNISPNVQLSATKKEVFTPIGWYQLNNHGGMTGNYQLNLTRFNPQVYRGQVTTLAQYMNQLAIDDMLFNHSMLLPSFKDDDISDNGAMINRLASANPVYAPYQYSKKDGGLWYRMYGTFETLQMSQGLSRVGNNAYGTIIGADFGLKDLRNGWKFMPTAYIGYNGAHQYFAGMGAYQNGGQAGFLGTWYKNNFVLGGLIYGGVYQNSMDIAGHTDNTFNYFAGASAKGAYNLRLHRDWVLQPNLMLAYNFFGQQNWHSDFGQMGMMSGTLNGINLAPGLNLIWEKETFSIYATLQYMYNLNGAVDGRAGNVSLPHLYMDRGYIQYGFGFTKRFSDRFAGYFQTVFRNVGRTGVGFQLGLNIKLGK